MAGEIRVDYVREFITGRPEDQFRELAQMANGLLKGRANNRWNQTLEIDATSTTIITDLAQKGVAVTLGALSANGAVALASGLVWAEVKAGEILIHHDSSTLTDRDICVVLVG